MPVSILIDAMLAVLFGLLVWRGYRRGFLGAMLSLGRLILSFWLTVIFGSAVADWVKETFIYPPIYESIHGKFRGLADEVAATANGGVEALTQKIPPFLRRYLDTDRLDPAVDLRAVADRWAETAADSLAGVISAVVGYLLLFAVSFALLTLVILALRGLVRGIGLLRTTDHLLGSILGAVSGGIAVLLVSAVLGEVLTVSGHGDVAEASLLLRLSEGVREMLFSLR